jgi:hypothetical protein
MSVCSIYLQIDVSMFHILTDICQYVPYTYRYMSVCSIYVQIYVSMFHIRTQLFQLVSQKQTNLRVNSMFCAVLFIIPYCSLPKYCHHFCYLQRNFARVVRIQQTAELCNWAGHVARMGEERGVYMVLVGKPEGKRSLERPRRRWVDNIIMDLQ